MDEIKLLRKDYVSLSNKILHATRKIKTSTATASSMENDPEDKPTGLPVMLDGVDLTKLCPRSTRSKYALSLGRYLWSDDELKHGKLFPERARGRDQICLKREELFKSISSYYFPLITCLFN